ncbi:MAG: hypothetical protein KDC07_02485 [Chitinophagaceae bacterium]|nr:hypothetical protein [Chitinophagaceae bacterium]
MSAELIILLQLAACFLVLFGIAELLYHFANVKAELTRKIVHIGTGLLTLLFPVYLSYTWQVVLICSSFLVLLLLSTRFRFLQAINNIDRKSAGSHLYPVIVVIVFIYYKYQSVSSSFDDYLYFYLPVLLMAICDPVAALVGNRLGQVKGQKTRAGSIAFFLSAVIVAVVLFSLFNTHAQSIAMTIVYSLGIALFTAIAERYSKHGLDNMTIPLAAIAFLWMSENIMP